LGGGGAGKTQAEGRNSPDRVPGNTKKTEGKKRKGFSKIGGLGKKNPTQNTAITHRGGEQSSGSRKKRKNAEF